MPEGPEIRRAADAIARVLEGRVVERLFFAFDRLKPYEERLAGRRVDEIATAGKALLTHFDNGLSIYSHNQLYGRWWVKPRDVWPATGRRLRLALHTATHSALLYSASAIEVLDKTGRERHPFLRRLGPDLLDKTTTVRQVRARFEDPRFVGKRLTTLLLDQGFLCGPGNYLRSEVLFLAGVNPRLRPVDCTPRQLDALARAAVYLTRRSYRSGGITNDLKRARALKAAGWRRADYRYYVFDRDGQACFACATTVVKENAGSRRVYYCPRCQPDPAAGAPD